jgi:hypothetical protein
LAETEVAWLLKRRNAALTKKQMWGSLFQKTYRLSQPNRNVFDMRPIGQNPGTFNIQGMDIAWYVFDLTLAHATDVWCNEIVNALCPAGKKWLNFVSGTAIRDEKRDEINELLQKRTDVFFKFLHRSNFQLVVHECFMDAAVSTGFMTVNEGATKQDPFVFVSNPPDCIYADEGPYGVFDAYYRDWVRLPWDTARVMWPNLIKPTNMTENADDEVLITLYEILYRDHDVKDGNKPGAWKYRVIHPDTRTLCYKRDDRTSAFIGWRVKKLAGETYGRGPAMDAVAAAGTINQALYDEIVSANFRALPMYMGFEDGVFNPNNFKMIPNTILACAPTASGTWPLTAVPAAGDIQWSMLILNELRDQINNIMHTNPLPAMDDPKATATEILKRDQRNIENRAAQDARIQKEFFGPLVERCIDILRRKGLWDDITVDGELIEVQFDTPLVTSQGQTEVIEMLQHIQFVQGIYGTEAASAFYNTEKLSPWAARKLNVDLEVIKKEPELLEMMQQVEDKKAQMAQQAQEQGVPEGTPTQNGAAGI